MLRDESARGRRKPAPTPWSKPSNERSLGNPVQFRSRKSRRKNTREVVALLPRVSPQRRWSRDDRGDVGARFGKTTRRRRRKNGASYRGHGNIRWKIR